MECLEYESEPHVVWYISRFTPARSFWNPDITEIMCLLYLRFIQRGIHAFPPAYHQILMYYLCSRPQLAKQPCLVSTLMTWESQDLFVDLLWELTDRMLKIYELF